MARIEINHVTKQFGSLTALDSVALKLEKGQIVGLLGPNGSGKTTLIKILNGLLQPTAGHVTINGMEPGVGTKRVVAYLPDRNALPDYMTASQLMDIYQDFFEDFDRQKAEAMVDDLGIDRKQAMKKMSKGTKEKLQQANSYFSMKTALENILGIILAGILYAAISIYPLFFLIGACFIASGISEMLIRYNHRPPQERLTLRLAVLDLKEGIDYLKAKKVLRVLLGTVLFFNFFNTPLMGNFPPFFVKTDLAGAPSYLFARILTPELWSSVFNVFFGISSLLGGAILSTRAQKEKCGRQLAIHLTMFASVMVILTLCYWHFVAHGASLNAFLITLCVGYFAIGLLVSYINIPTVTAMMRIVDKDKLSKMASLVNIGGMGMTPIASVLAGTILGTRGCTPLLAFCSAGLLVTALLLLASPQSKEF